MIVILFRILILIAIAFLIYTWIEYTRNPERQLKIAKQSNHFYMVDEANNSKKNLKLVYKGCVFEGEKYIGVVDDSFEVVDIDISIRDPFDLKGFTREDLYFLENEILIRYPHAKIKWKHPINEILITKME
ncbi:sigma-w pathway protein ysdB [Oceanobacillus caeni]|uniref:Sigma-w pathway protein ysdB n=1 Tax=Oceanobacillus caeni TaxID=405946 RepID=A0ABR5MI68_9BACI|nr:MULTISPECIES: hypothetical protein [Bacillaceae]KPH73920.1 sigma-w pathway protein ysdB [Oceanobacillus caeni]MCR1834162.1 sigma-w pathway protein ysdB [Oceanobacillus caeni]MED4476123.1 sigma-w pathway protein ysdB [Oceanobacillus caeni]